MFTLLFKYEKDGEWSEIMTATRDEIYSWLDSHSGYDSKIIRSK